MIEQRLSEQRGVGDHGWLNSRHTFSFANYWDPKQAGFSDLLVINDDRVAKGRGFGAHPHSNMEIISYVLEGALEHKDSMGTGSVIVPGDVQLMSAGSGVTHSEFNHSGTEGVHFLQIWVVPAEKNSPPGYQQVSVSEADKRGNLRLIISPEGENGALRVRQDIRIYAGLFQGMSSRQSLCRTTAMRIFMWRAAVSGLMACNLMPETVRGFAMRKRCRSVTVKERRCCYSICVPTK